MLWEAAEQACRADGAPGWAQLSWARSLELTNSARSSADIPAGAITET